MVDPKFDTPKELSVSSLAYKEDETQFESVPLVEFIVLKLLFPSMIFIMNEPP